LEPAYADGVAAAKKEATMARFAHRALHKMQAAWQSALLLAAMAFFAMIAVGARERRAEPHGGGNVTNHDVIPMIGTAPNG
jgi:hypothetical protein